jgi:hypothetical protein
MKMNVLRHLPSAFFLITACGPCITFAVAQPPATQLSATRGQETPSAMVQPALDTLTQALEVLRPEKWKASDAIKEETSSNISSIHRDIQTTLPQLLATADPASNSVSQLLPVYRNVEALYDVLLRVAQVANLAAPNQQSAAIDHAREILEDARRALGDRLGSAALAQEQQVHSLQAALRAVPQAPAPVACPTPAPVKKPRRRRKSVAKPASPSSSTQPNQQGGTSASH